MGTALCAVRWPRWRSSPAPRDSWSTNTWRIISSAVSLFLRHPFGNTWQSTIASVSTAEICVQNFDVTRAGLDGTQITIEQRHYDYLGVAIECTADAHGSVEPRRSTP